MHPIQSKKSSQVHASFVGTITHTITGAMNNDPTFVSSYPMRAILCTNK